MVQAVEIKVFPDQINNTAYLEDLVRQNLGKKASLITHMELSKRSIDARSKRPQYVLRYEVYLQEPYIKPELISSQFKDVSKKKEVVIVGAGPAGYFAALECLELGLKPVVLDRGKDVQARRRDLRAIQQDGIVNPDSNYCFGEGGAGTYSDGKLYTRSHKRGQIEKVLHLLVEHGAVEDVLIDAHPHIGSNKLPVIISEIRETIIKYGGEVHFNQKVSDFKIQSNKIEGVFCGETFWKADAVILATGHSARDIYYLLHQKNIKIEAKPFALGLRIEHAQSFIDKLQYHQAEREENLPASSYSVVSQVLGKGVFSFCMCPGGLVVPAATAPGEIVVNGMSLSRRDSPYANSGYVTAIDLDELEKQGYQGVFACLDFQKVVEQAMFQAGDGSQKAPAQRVDDFVKGIISPTLNESSYIPGLFSAPLHQLLPRFVYERLRQGIIDVEQKMPGFQTNKANIIGVESRTSAPVRIPRNTDTLMHEQIQGLFPCGEGAGYAGGILSAAMDGQKVAKGVKEYFQN